MEIKGQSNQYDFNRAYAASAERLNSNLESFTNAIAGKTTGSQNQTGKSDTSVQGSKFLFKNSVGSVNSAKGLLNLVEDGLSAVNETLGEMKTLTSEAEDTETSNSRRKIIGQLLDSYAANIDNFIDMTKSADGKGIFDNIEQNGIAVPAKKNEEDVPELKFEESEENFSAERLAVNNLDVSTSEAAAEATLTIVSALEEVATKLEQTSSFEQSLNSREIELLSEAGVRSEALSDNGPYGGKINGMKNAELQLKEVINQFNMKTDDAINAQANTNANNYLSLYA